MKQSPTSRSTAWLRKRGFSVCKVEQRLPIPGKFVTRDAFNVGDLLAMKEGFGIALVQVTSDDTGGNLTARIRKIIGIPETRAWLAAGGRILAQAWGRRGPRKEYRIRGFEIIQDDGQLFAIDQEGRI